MARTSIKLHRLSSPTRSDISFQHTWPLSVYAEGDGISSDVFVHQYIPGEGISFRNIASVHDLNDLPAGMPAIDKDKTSFFRKSGVDLDCMSVAEVEEAWQKIEEDVKDLVENYSLHERLNYSYAVNVTIGDNEDQATVEVVEDPTTAVVITLSNLPAGIVYSEDPVTDMNYIMAENDTELHGWLAVNSASNISEDSDYELYNDGEEKPALPAGTILFYNIYEDEEALDALTTPTVSSVSFIVDGAVESASISRNGNYIFWKTPSASLYAAQTPWGPRNPESTDFLDRINPGSFTKDIKMVVRYAV